MKKYVNKIYFKMIESNYYKCVNKIQQNNFILLRIALNKVINDLELIISGQEDILDSPFDPTNKNFKIILQQYKNNLLD
jgi:hypothetical protein